jgi:hypothetical protein
MAGADTSLWPVVVGGLLAGLFALGGIGVGLVGTARRDAAQERREAKKRREDKFEEFVAAVYEFDYWLEGVRDREAFGRYGIPMAASPFAKVEAISAVYYPQFQRLIADLWVAADRYQNWIRRVADERKDGRQGTKDFLEVLDPYMAARGALLDAIKNFPREEFQ